MSIEAGRAYFRQFGMEDRVQEFTVSSATVDLAAKALGGEGARIANTLSFKTADGCMLILAAGDALIDNHKFKQKFHMKAKMLSADEVLELVGHPVGGVCPFGCKEGIPVYLDMSMQRFETVAAQLACHRVYTGKEYLIGCLSGGALRVEAWRSLYRRAFLQQNDLHFQKGIMHEDEEFTPRALLAAQKVVLSDRAFYHYDNARTGSIMNNSAASLRKLTHRVQIYNQQRELYRTVQPRRLRRLLEDDLSWKYLDCVCRYDPAKRDELAVGRTVPLRCAYKPKRKLKALAYAICPTLYTNHFGKN